MNRSPRRQPCRPHSPARRWRHALAACALVLGCAPTLANAGPMDFLFSGLAPPSSSAGRGGIWRYGEFSALRLVPREAGSTPNAQPAAIDAQALQALLAGVEWLGAGGAKPVALFGSAELAELTPALANALAEAGPDHDILLLATARRNQGLLSTPLSISARLFVAEGALQLLVHDARSDVYSSFRGSNVPPQLNFGSRAAASGMLLRSAAALSRRPDWLALDLRAGASRAAPAVPAAPVQPLPLATPAAAAAAPAMPAARDAAFFEQQEQRLKGLKRLREQGLITEAEYEQKRRAILDSL